jgi:glyoxylase-like metal-dependent hydrolase (beta-lactamase superfamily II)
MSINQPNLTFPFRTAPDGGELLEVAPGIMWLRMPLPFLLDHVNIYLIEDHGGWTIVDTGIATDVCKEVWNKVLSGPFAGQRINRVIVTHYHPDHIGLAGWLCDRLEAQLLVGQMSYLASSNISLSPGALEASVYRDFYLRNGTSKETADIVTTSGHAYLRMVSTLPPTFIRLTAGDLLPIGGRTFQLLSGEGHAPEQLMLYSDADDILLSADQVIEKITPNISVWALDPEGDPLGLYLRSVEQLIRDVSDDVLVLSGHRLPFIGLHTRCKEIVNHHETRCELIALAAAKQPHTVSELVPVLFRRRLDPHQLSFAFSETLAHVNYMIRRGSLRWVGGDDIRRVMTS